MVLSRLPSTYVLFFGWCRRSSHDFGTIFAAYTSLLRITTTPPTKEEKDIETRPSTSTEGPAEPAAVSEPATLPPSAVPGGGVLASLRPAFFRGNSRPSNNATEMAESASSLVPTLPPDLERGPDPAPASGPATVS